MSIFSSASSTSLWRCSSSSTRGTLVANSSIWSATSIGSAPCPSKPADDPCQSPVSPCLLPWLARSSSTESFSASRAPRNSSSSFCLRCCIQFQYSVSSIAHRIKIHNPSSSCLETPLCLEARKYLREGIRRSGNDQKSGCGERIVHYRRPCVIAECPYIVVAHDQILECPLCRQLSFLGRHILWGSFIKKREIAIDCFLPREHACKCVFI